MIFLSLVKVSLLLAVGWLSSSIKIFSVPVKVPHTKVVLLCYKKAWALEKPVENTL